MIGVEHLCLFPKLIIVKGLAGIDGRLPSHFKCAERPEGMCYCQVDVFNEAPEIIRYDVDLRRLVFCQAATGWSYV